jgi:hypothetical protein
MVTDVLAETANVVTLKLAEACPAGTLTTPGTCAADELFVVSVTEIPPEGEGELRNTVPVALVPPLTLVGLMVRDCNNGGAFGSGATLTKIDFVTPPAVAKTFPPVAKPETGLVHDVRNVVATGCDMNHIEKWTRELGLDNLWQQCRS